ncbi:hypothetical protein AVEN_69832-1 [Araneus ventricosus]|uniref:Uncharacterized protein n=1 Tax=Araneus ventricosus TaxID=182803 RepID=A0A4Y2KC98_ARAVE|nr:hypothetical protein AVEN_69832-1 [Araneus ventricosus]
MVIGGVDAIETEQEKRGKRKQMEDERIKRKMVKTDAESMELLDPNSMSLSSYTDTNVITLEYKSQNRLDFPTLARECDRYGISDRAAASIDSAVL